MSNYPEGLSMRGSGIYEREETRFVDCGAYVPETGEHCEFSGDVDVHIDDWNQAAWDCPDCGTQHEMEPPEPDPDEAYERMRDAQMEDW